MKSDVLVVGAGPAGLAAALELRAAGVQDVLVVDREHEPGGVPRHCAHTGYGVRDRRRLLTGPAYARHYVRAAEAAGVKIRAATTLTALTADGPDPAVAQLTSGAGIETMQADAVLLATGCRERPRAARLVPGSRPAGVLTTGELQQRVYLYGERLASRRAVIVGAEHVSFSAVVTLAHAGAEVVALVTDQARHQSVAPFRLGARLIWHAPVWTGTSVTEILGGDRVTGVRLRDGDGTDRIVACDLVVFTGDWMPDHEHARLAGARMDPGSHGPIVDTALRTTLPRVFAAGNLVHPAETADVAALTGRHAARQIARLLAGPFPPGGETSVPVTVTDPLLWIAPAAVGVPGPQPPRGRFVLRSAAYVPVAHLEARQDGRRLYGAWTRLLPGRSIRLAGGWVSRVNEDGGPVQVSVT